MYKCVLPLCPFRSVVRSVVVDYEIEPDKNLSQSVDVLKEIKKN